MNVEATAEVDRTANETSPQGRWIALLIAIFFVGLLPTLPDLSRYHGDERFYTDAAITMVQTGDYLTPRYADGTERFKKPLLTYWALCVSYKIFGISVFSSRLPFLLAGCGVVWLTWRLGRTLFGSREPALVGTLVIAANIQTMTIATRSTPDILLCLFVTASLCGFAELLLRDSRTWKSYALAYLGAGLACATKGLWGALPVLFALVFWAFATRPRLPLLRVAPLAWVFAGAAVGLSWFIAAAVMHGRSSLEIFLKDQTMASPEPVKWLFISNVMEYAWATVRHFVPWILIAAAGACTAWASLKEFVRCNRQALWFALGWYAMVFAIFSFGSLVRTRYLLPTYPCIAVACGALLDHLARQPRPAAWLQRFVVALLSAAIVVGAVSVIGWRLDWRAGVGGLFMAAAATVLLRLCRRTEPLFALGSFLIVAFSVVMLTWRPLFGINPADALARQLSEPQFAGRPLAALGIPPVISSQLRLVSGGKLNPREVPSPKELVSNAVVLVGESWREQVAVAGYKLTIAPFRTKRARAKDIWKALRTGRKEDSLDSGRQDFFIAVRE